MPVVGIPTDRLRRLLGREIEPDALLEQLGHLGCDVEGYTELARVRCRACGAVHEMTASEEIPPLCDTCQAPLREAHEALPPLEVVRMELLAVRPDMFDPGGLARALRGYLGLETGAPHYALDTPAARVCVEQAVTEPDAYRPEIACAVVRNVTLDDDTLKILMKLQENLHWAIGRNRKHASIGVYDFDTVGDEFVYTAEDPGSYCFVPLGAGGQPPVTLREILAHHPKGTAYAHLLRQARRYPILRDRDGQVLSMPPIINSEATRVTRASRQLLIDVTGHVRRLVLRTLNIMVTSLCENLPGVEVATVAIERPTGECWVSPDFTPQPMEVDPDAAGRLLGVSITTEQGIELLSRMRHAARPAQAGRIAVAVPAYRNDILHEVDLIEDLAIAYGYHNLEPTLVPTFTVGGERPIEGLSDRLRQLFCGLGFHEVMSLVLTSEQSHDTLLGHVSSDEAVTIANPVSGEQTMLRTQLLPGLVEVFRRNVTHPLPQAIFEIGEVTRCDAQAETGAVDRRAFAAGIVAARTGFEEIKAVAEAVLREFDCRVTLRPISTAPFLDGRAAAAYRDAGAAPCLRFGEVQPEVLERCGIQSPMVLLEGDVAAVGSLAAEQE